MNPLAVLSTPPLTEAPNPLAIALFPLMLTPVVLGITFRILFNYSYGIVNHALDRMGIAPVV